MAKKKAPQKKVLKKAIATARKAAGKASVKLKLKQKPKPVATSTKSKRMALKANLAARMSYQEELEVIPAEKPLKKTTLSKSELDMYRKLLLEKRSSLLGDMNGLAEGSLHTSRQDGSGDLSNMPTHPADVGTDNFEHEFSLGLLESERTLLNEINEALDRIKDMTYGICLGTGRMIDKARLKARPWTKFCIEYARMLEKGGVRPNIMENRSMGEGSEEDESVEDESEVEGEEETPRGEDAEG